MLNLPVTQQALRHIKTEQMIGDLYRSGRLTDRAVDAGKAIRDAQVRAEWEALGVGRKQVADLGSGYVVPRAHEIPHTSFGPTIRALKDLPSEISDMGRAGLQQAFTDARTGLTIVKQSPALLDHPVSRQVVRHFKEESARGDLHRSGRLTDTAADAEKLILRGSDASRMADPRLREEARCAGVH